MSPLPNLAGLAPAQPLGDAGLAPAKPLGDAPLIDLIATIPFQHAGRNSSRQSETTPDGGTIGDIMVFGQDQLTWGAHLRRAQRARRVRLLRKQPNQSNPTTWRLAAMNVGMRLARQSATTPGIDVDFGKAPTGPYTRSSTRPLHALIA